MTTPTPPSDLIEEIARSMLAVSRPNANADDLTPAPRGSLGMIPKWKLYEHLAQAAYAVVRERIETLEGLLWRAMDDASIEPDTWYAEARALLGEPMPPGFGDTREELSSTPPAHSPDCGLQRGEKCDCGLLEL